MTYYLKYLKYKNKYLELKNMVGGDFTGDDKKLNELWKARSITKKVFPVTYPKLQNAYSHYCWISGTEYGLGFFLYRLKKGQKPVEGEGHVQNGNYALKHVTKNNIGQPELINAKVCEGLKYSTTIELTATNGSKIPQGTSFDWSDCQDAWVYKVINKDEKGNELVLFYKANFK